MGATLPTIDTSNAEATKEETNQVPEETAEPMEEESTEDVQVEEEEEEDSKGVKRKELEKTEKELIEEFSSDDRVLVCLLYTSPSPRDA